jgi:hypothetical protein
VKCRLLLAAVVAAALVAAARRWNRWQNDYDEQGG